MPDPDVLLEITKLRISSSSKTKLNHGMSHDNIDLQLMAIKTCIRDEEYAENKIGVLDLNQFLFDVMCDYPTDDFFPEGEVAALAESIRDMAIDLDRQAREARQLARSTPGSGVATVIELRRAPRPIFGGRRKHYQW